MVESDEKQLAMRVVNLSSKKEGIINGQSMKHQLESFSCPGGISVAWRRFPEWVFPGLIPTSMALSDGTGFSSQYPIIYPSKWYWSNHGITRNSRLPWKALQKSISLIPFPKSFRKIIYSFILQTSMDDDTCPSMTSYNWWCVPFHDGQAWPSSIGPGLEQKERDLAHPWTHSPFSQLTNLGLPSNFVVSHRVILVCSWLHSSFDKSFKEKPVSFWLVTVSELTFAKCSCHFIVAGILFVFSVHHSHRTTSVQSQDICFSLSVSV